MGKVEYRAPLIYIYLDSAGIDSLFAQTTERVETQYVTEREGNREGKVGLGAALKALFFADVNASTEVTVSGRKMEQVTAMLSIEQKLAGLIRYLNRFENEKYFDNIHQAIYQCSQQKGSVFINIETEFDLPQFYWGRESGVKNVNLVKAISFELSPSPDRPNTTVSSVGTGHSELPLDPYDASDNYFKRQPFVYKPNKPRVLMSASLNKFPRILGEIMNEIGHEATNFGIREGMDVPLGVFGSLTTLGNNKYQIKPYAIWYQ